MSSQSQSQGQRQIAAMPELSAEYSNPLKFEYSYQSFVQDIYYLHKQITDDGLMNHLKPSAVYAIPRGGLLMGTVLSHMLNVPLLTTPEHVGQLNPDIAHWIIVVDDIADTGHSLDKHLELLRHHLKKRLFSFANITTATLHFKPQSKVRPDFTVHIVANNVWICYFWEMFGVDMADAKTRAEYTLDANAPIPSDSFRGD